MAGPSFAHVADLTLSNVSATAGAASATKAAPAQNDPPLCYYVTRLSASFSTAQIGTLTITSNAVAIHTFYVHNSRDVSFSSPLKLPPNQDITINLSAAAAASTGSVNADCFLAEG